MGMQYTWSLHWSLAQFPGEQVFKPANHAERSFALAVLFLFFVVAAMFVSSITTSMTRLQIIAGKQSSQFADLRRYLVDNQISRQLAVRVQRNAQHAIAEHSRNIPEKSVELLALISGPLHAELHFEVYSPVLLLHPFFSTFHDFNPLAVQKLCHTAVSAHTVSQGDVLFSDFETPARPRMFFIVSGSMEYTGRRRALAPRPGDAGPLARRLGAGDWVCEAVLWTRWKHRGTLTAQSDCCRLLDLDAQTFFQVCETFPSVHPAIYAEEFVSHLNDLSASPTNMATDLAFGGFQLGRMLERAFPDPEEIVSRQTSESAVSRVPSWRASPRRHGHPEKLCRRISSGSVTDERPRRGSVLPAFGRIGSLRGQQRGKIGAAWASARRWSMVSGQDAVVPQPSTSGRLAPQQEAQQRSSGGRLGDGLEEVVEADD